MQTELTTNYTPVVFEQLKTEVDSNLAKALSWFCNSCYVTLGSDLGQGQAGKLSATLKVGDSPLGFSPVPRQFVLLLTCFTMLQNTLTIRHYQALTDRFTSLWSRGYRTDDLRLYLDGYLSALRQDKSLEPILIHRLEEEALRFIQDPSNFEVPYY